jgi:hypothetical protein
MDWIKWLGIIVGVLTLAGIGVTLYGSARWAQNTKDLLDRLEAARVAPSIPRYDAASELAGLPPPVQRYFRAVLTDGQPIIQAVAVNHEGTFNMGQTTDSWKRFTSRQRVVTRRPGFVWDGKVMMMPGVPVYVHDAYVAGEGILHPTILGLFSLVDMRGTGDVAHGEMMRFFAEAAWYPTALLPSQGVRWAAVDERTARATIKDADLSLTMTFQFDDDGLIRSARAEKRGRTVGNDIIMTPWEGRWSDYQERDGMRVPMSGEVAWMTPEGRKPYWRGKITSLRYEFAK